MSNWFGYLLMAVMVCGVTVGLVLAIDSAASLPDVHFSYKTNDCVKVVNYIQDHNYTCDDLPTKYYHVWEE